LTGGGIPRYKYKSKKTNIMSTTKQLSFTSGYYASTGTGNFMALDETGTEYFIPAAKMLASGIAKDVMPVFPFYAFGNTRMIGSFIPGTKDPLLDEFNQPILRPRLEATAIYLDFEAFKNVANAGFKMRTDLQADRETIVKMSGLTEESMAMLLSASI
jgi:hypothetical protein